MEDHRIRALGEAGAALAREAAAIALLLDCAKDSRVEAAARQAQEALDELERHAEKCDAEAYRAALWAMTSAAVALTEARRLIGLREIPSLGGR